MELQEKSPRHRQIVDSFWIQPASVDAKINTLESEGTVRQASEYRPSVPVNLTSKLIRKQQTVKFKSVSAGFPNHSYAGYRQGSADTEGDKRSCKMSV